MDAAPPPPASGLIGVRIALWMVPWSLPIAIGWAQHLFWPGSPPQLVFACLPIVVLLGYVDALLRCQQKGISRHSLEANLTAHTFAFVGKQILLMPLVFVMIFQIVTNFL